MQCTRCGNDRWAVTNTAHGNNRERKALISIVEPSLIWYSNDFRVRARKCKKCGNIGHTIEILMEDLLAIMNHARTDPLPNCESIEGWCEIQNQKHRKS